MSDAIHIFIFSNPTNIYISVLETSSNHICMSIDPTCGLELKVYKVCFILLLFVEAVVAVLFTVAEAIVVVMAIVTVVAVRK